jgi:hypothetical protein
VGNVALSRLSGEAFAVQYGSVVRDAPQGHLLIEGIAARFKLYSVNGEADNGSKTLV